MSLLFSYCVTNFLIGSRLLSTMLQQERKKILEIHSLTVKHSSVSSRNLFGLEGAAWNAFWFAFGLRLQNKEVTLLFEIDIAIWKCTLKWSQWIFLVWLKIVFLLFNFCFLYFSSIFHGKTSLKFFVFVFVFFFLPFFFFFFFWLAFLLFAFSFVWTTERWAWSILLDAAFCFWFDTPKKICVADGDGYADLILADVMECIGSFSRLFYSFSFHFQFDFATECLLNSLVSPLSRFIVGVGFIDSLCM